MIAPPDTALSLIQAFPCALASDVAEVLSLLPASAQEMSLDTIGPVFLGGKPIQIPYRIYRPLFDVSPPLSRCRSAIRACIYTRHHDGRIRETSVKDLLDCEESWVCPYVLQLSGEYVLEIVELLAGHPHVFQRKEYLSFARENPRFMALLQARMVSYWDYYNRGRFRDVSQYPGFRIIEALRG